MRSTRGRGFLGIAPKCRTLRLCSAHDDRFSNSTGSRMVRLSSRRWRSHGRHRCRSAFSAPPHSLVHSGNHRCPREDTHGYRKLHRSKNLIQVRGLALRECSSHPGPGRSVLSPTECSPLHFRGDAVEVPKRDSFRPGYTRIWNLSICTGISRRGSRLRVSQWKAGLRTAVR